MDLSVLFFGDSNQADATAHCDLVLDVSRRADQLGLHAIWLPERHHHVFGGPFPNPSVMAAAVAAVTSTIRVRAGSVVLPLHQAVRVAEEWSVVDALSHGRVDIAFATGWNPDDFTLAPTAFDDRRANTIAEIDVVRRLWEGECIELPNGLGDTIEVRTFPRPVQQSLTPWLTCTASPAGFETAGSGGFNVLTALLHQTPEQLGQNIERYRKARAESGHSGLGTVTLMLHTFVGESEDHARDAVREPLTAYLSSSADLWSVSLPSLGRLDGFKAKLVMDLAIERYTSTAGLVGTVESCATTLERMSEAGVDEIACLVDFGLAPSDVLEGVERLGELAGIAGRQGPR